MRTYINEKIIFLEENSKIMTIRHTFNLSKGGAIETIPNFNGNFGGNCHVDKT